MVARIRTIKPHFFRSYDVAALSYRARLTWVGLWTYVDDEGRGRDDARIIKGELWALEDDVTWQDVERDLTELSRSAHVTRYTVDGRDYLAIPTWLEHQVISRPTKSKFPEPNPMNTRDASPITEDSLSTHGANTAGKGTGNREREQGTGKQELSLAATEQAFEEAYAHWPKRVERKEALARFRVAVKRIDPADLVAHIERFGKAYAATTERQFIPALGPWLNGERWTDELPVASAPKPNGGGTDWALRMGAHKPTKTERAQSVIEMGRQRDQARGQGVIEA